MLTFGCNYFKPELLFMKRILLPLVITLISCTLLHAQDTASAQYVGKYIFPGGSVVPSVEVTFDNGSLSMGSTAGTSPLENLGADSFNILNFSGYAVFKRDGNSKVVAVHIEASGYVLDGPKDSTAKASYAGAFLPSGNWWSLKATPAQVRLPIPSSEETSLTAGAPAWRNDRKNTAAIL
jgi:hypothetical protein